MARRLPLSLLGVLILALVACTAQDGTEDAPADSGVTIAVPSATEVGLTPVPEATSPKRTEEARSLVATAQEAGRSEPYRFYMELTIRGLGAEGDISLKANGLVDEQTERMTLAMDSGRPGELALATTEMIVLDDAVYLRGEPYSSMVDTPWASAHASALLGPQDPWATSTLGALTPYAEAGELVAAAAETIRGVETTRWDGTIDLIRLAEVQGNAIGAAQIRSLRDLSEDEAFGSALPISLWVDADGRMQRFQMEYSLDLTVLVGERTIAEYEILMEAYDYGVEFEVEIPDPEDVTDISALLG